MNKIKPSYVIIGFLIFIIIGMIIGFIGLLVLGFVAEEEIPTVNTIDSVESIKESPKPTKKPTKEVELTPGNYISGKHFVPGIYDVKSIKGEFGTVTSTNMFEDGISTCMGSDPTAQQLVKNVNLPEGINIKVDSVTIKLIPAK